MNPPSRLPTWIRATSEGTIVRIQVQPNAKKSEIVGEHGASGDVRLKIRIASPPVDGKANETLLAFLRKATGVSASRIRLVRGDTSRAKDVLFEGTPPEELFEKLRT